MTFLHLNNYAWVPPLKHITFSFVQFQNSGMMDLSVLKHSCMGPLHRIILSLVFYRPQRSCEGYVFTGICLSRGGCLLRGAWSRGVGVCLLPGGLVWGRGVPAPMGAGLGQGNAWSWGCLLPGGCLVLGGWYPSMHWGRHPPRQRWLLLWMVRIPLECILIFNFNIQVWWSFCT